MGFFDFFKAFFSKTGELTIEFSPSAVFYTYMNPNKKDGRISWSEDRHGNCLDKEPCGKRKPYPEGDQIENLVRDGQLLMREDETDAMGATYGSGHAICLSDEKILHPNFKKVSASGDDGAKWWTDKLNKDHVRMLADKMEL